MKIVKRWLPFSVFQQPTSWRQAVLLVFGLACMARDILVLEKKKKRYLSSYVQMVAYCLVLLFLISSSI